ncbi:MAG TPA: UDP binding domain-containing protein, partial [Thermoanaerobaculia bacterium]|nr:UDP binding domain-containing protein [Thermoanaerobaculia bacterium]
GPGFGGSCFPKDTRAAAQIARDAGLRFRIIEAVLDANERTKHRMVGKIERALGGIAGKRIGVLGLSFKPNTDDIRESPALPVVRGLIDGGAQVCAFDPEAMAGCRPLFPEAEFCDNAYEAATGADALVIATEWNQFRKLELPRLHRLMRRPLVVDLRNLYEPEKMAAENFEYVSVGRPDGMPDRRVADQGHPEGAPDRRHRAGRRGAKGANGANGAHGSNGADAADTADTDAADAGDATPLLDAVAGRPAGRPGALPS